MTLKHSWEASLKSSFSDQINRQSTLAELIRRYPSTEASSRDIQEENHERSPRKRRAPICHCTWSIHIIAGRTDPFDAEADSLRFDQKFEKSKKGLWDRIEQEEKNYPENCASLHGSHPIVW